MKLMEAHIEFIAKKIEKNLSNLKKKLVTMKY